MKIKYKIFLLALVVVLMYSLAACAPDVTGVPQPRPAPQSSIDTGRQLMAGYGCGSCHTIPGIPGADAKAAPPLDHFYARSYIAGKLPNTEQNLVQWIQDPQKIVPGNAMPNLGVTQAEARDIAAYLYHQQSLGDLFNR